MNTDINHKPDCPEDLEPKTKVLRQEPGERWTITEHRCPRCGHAVRTYIPQNPSVSGLDNLVETAC